MPQPKGNDLAAEKLIRVYEAAHERLVAQYEAAVLDPRRARQTARLRELIKTNEVVVDGLVNASRDWIAATLPELHGAGATAAADIIGSAFQWTTPHYDAVEQIAQRTWVDIATRLRDVRSDTRKALQQQVGDATRSALLENKTATQAGRDLAKEAASQGLFSVEYSNGARHTIRDYADSVIRTTTAEAYNRGSVTQCRVDGIEYVEYLDGAGCGVGPGHNVGPEANGLIVPLDEVVYLSHPRCRRAISPAVDGPASKAAKDRMIGDARPPEPEKVPARPAREPRTPRQQRQAPTAGPTPWKDQTTPKGATDQLIARHGTDAIGPRSIGFSGMNGGVANDAAKALDDMLTRFPRSGESVRVVGSSSHVSGWLKGSEGRTAPRMRKGVMGDAQQARGWIRLSQSFKSREAISSTWERAVARGWFPQGTDGMGSVVRHEFGHHMDFLATKNGGEAYRRAISDVLADFTAEDGVTVRTLLSRYSAKNDKELMAEAVSEATSSPSPRPFARALFDVLLDYTERWKGTVT